MPKQKSAKYYLKKLCQFPHRGCPSEYDKKAADLIFSELKKAGLKPKIDRFKTAKNHWLNNAIHYFIFSVSVLFLVLQKPLISLILYSITLVSWIVRMKKEIDIFELLFYSWTQNIVAKIKSSKKIKRRIILLGHYDSAHMTFILNQKLGIPVAKIISIFPKGFRTPFFIPNFALYLLPLLIILNLIGFKNSLITLFIFFCLIVLLLTTVLLAHMAFSPFVQGAFDNGSGAAIVMSLASYFKNKPLKNTEIWLLLNSAEENGFSGSKAFCNKYGKEFDKQNTFFINLDGLGASQIRFATGESSLFLFEHYYDEHMILLAKKLAKKPKFKGNKPMFISVTSDGKIFIQNGFRGIYIFSLEDYGYVKHYHQMSDTIDNMNFKNLELAKDFVKELILELDKEA